MCASQSFRSDRIPCVCLSVCFLNLFSDRLPCICGCVCFFTLFSDRVTLCLCFLPYWAARPWWRHTLPKDCGNISLCAIEVALGWTFAVDANQSKLPADRLVLRLSPGVQIAVGRHVIKGKDWSKLARVVHQGCEDKLRCRIEHGQIGAAMLS